MQLFPEIILTTQDAKTIVMKDKQILLESCRLSEETGSENFQVAKVNIYFLIEEVQFHLSCRDFGFTLGHYETGIKINALMRIKLNCLIHLGLFEAIF